jgi:hypothetical protein
MLKERLKYTLIIVHLFDGEKNLTHPQKRPKNSVDICAKQQTKSLRNYAEILAVLKLPFRFGWRLHRRGILAAMMNPPVPIIVTQNE